MHTSSLPDLTTAPSGVAGNPKSTGHKSQSEEGDAGRVVCDEGDSVHVYGHYEDDDDISIHSTDSEEVAVSDLVGVHVCVCGLLHAMVSFILWCPRTQRADCTFITSVFCV